MREIKFRAWHRAEKRMFTPEATKSLYLNLSDAWVMDSRIDDGVDVELMQFTGLEDKNGVEIYEGDIVVATVLNNHSQKEVEFFRGAVEMKWGEWSFNTANLWKYQQEKRVEVVGNIYETPELLAPASGGRE